MRQIIFDTETTGMNEGGKNVAEGHRIIEIGCVELINRMPTENFFHVYYNPEQEVDEAAFKVHGMNWNFLRDKPLFAEKLEEFEAYIEGADELIAHNISFDRQFVDMELKRAGRNYKLSDKFQLVDSLKMAKDRFPGARNNLDVLCRRFGVDNSNRELHGALLDAELLSEIYLKLTGGQSDLLFHSADTLRRSGSDTNQIATRFDWIPAKITDSELQAHQQMMLDITPKQEPSSNH